MRTLALIVCFALPLSISAQRQTGWGITGSWLRSSLTPSNPWREHISAGGWRAGIFIDKPLTHRFSLHAELSTQYIPDRPAPLTGYKHEIYYPELGLGATEYFPMGRGALYFTAFIFAAYGIGRETPFNTNGEPGNSTDIFLNPYYNRIRMGINLRMGYQFANGFSIHSAAQTGVLTPFANYPDMDLRYTESNWQIIGLSYMIGYHSRLLNRSGKEK